MHEVHGVGKLGERFPERQLQDPSYETPVAAERRPAQQRQRDGPRRLRQRHVRMIQVLDAVRRVQVVLIW